MLLNMCICFNSNLIEIRPLYSTFNQACMLKPGLSHLVSLQLCCCFLYPETALLNQCLLSEPDRRCCFQFISWEGKACSRIAAGLPVPLYNSQPLRGITTSNTQLRWRRQWDLCHLCVVKPRFHPLSACGCSTPGSGFSGSPIKGYSLLLS